MTNPYPQGRGWMRQFADLSTLGLVFPIAMILGYLGGQQIGSWFGAPYAGKLVGALLGLAAGFYNAFRTIQRLNAADEEREAQRAKSHE